SFVFPAEDCIRVFHVTGVQTCALPISCAQQEDRAAAHQTTRMTVCVLAYPSVSLRAMSPTCTQQCAENGSDVTPKTIRESTPRRARNRVSAMESGRQQGANGQYARA